MMTVTLIFRYNNNNNNNNNNNSTDFVKYLWNQPTIDWAMQIFTFYADKILGIINYALALYDSYVEWHGFSFVRTKVVAELLLPRIFG
jgi:hypothetical protein